MGVKSRYLENLPEMGYVTHMRQVPRYVPNVSKALEVILWIASRAPGMDIYHVVKASFFADKQHVAKYGRPICGDSYTAAPFGPLPQVIYNLLRNDPIEMIALDSNGELPFTVDKKHRVYADRDANERRLSKTDIAALEYGVQHVADMSFEEIYQETHADPAYVNADGMLMDYRDFIPDDDDDKAEKIEDIEDTACYAVF